MDEEMEPVPYEYDETSAHWNIKLYMTNDHSRCRAVLYRNLTMSAAEELYDKINEAFGHKRDDEGDLIVLGGTLPYVLID